MKKNTLYWLVGFCVFLAVILSGFNWLILKFNWSIPVLSTIVSYAKLVLAICAYVVGLVWCLDIKGKLLKTIFLALYIAFVVLSLMGIMNWAL